MKNVNRHLYEIQFIQLLFSNLLSEACNQIDKEDNSLKAKIFRFKSKRKIRKAKRLLLRNIKNKERFSVYEIYNFLLFLNHASKLNLINQTEDGPKCTMFFHIPENNPDIFRTGSIAVSIREKTKTTNVTFYIYLVDRLDPYIEVSWDISDINAHIVDYKNIIADTTGYKFNVYMINRHYENTENTDVYILKNSVYPLMLTILIIYIEFIFSRMEDMI